MAAMAAFQLASSYFAAENARDTAELNQNISEWNAEFAELDAHDAITEGETQVAQYQAVVDATLSDQRTSLAAADVDINFGSAGEVVKESRFIADINRMEIEKQAQEKALGYKRQARDFRLGGAIQRSADEGRASAIQAGGVTGALGTLAKADFTGYGGGAKGSNGFGKPLVNARNEITGHQTLTKDF